jgi:hypothetical protein
MISGNLHQGNFLVYLDGVVLAPGATANFSVGIPHNLTLTAVGAGNAFAGLLFRLGGDADTTKALQVPHGDTDLKVAELVCVQAEKAGGVTHKNNNGWTTKTVVLHLDGYASDLPLDVTVVVQNDNVASIWYYSAYTLNAVGGNVSAEIDNSPSSSLRGNSSSLLSPTASGTDSQSTTTTSPSKGLIVVVVLLALLSAASFANLVAQSGFRKPVKELES